MRSTNTTRCSRNLRNPALEAVFQTSLEPSETRHGGLEDADRRSGIGLHYFFWQALRNKSLNDALMRHAQNDQIFRAIQRFLHTRQ